MNKHFSNELYRVFENSILWDFQKLYDAHYHMDKCLNLQKKHGPRHFFNQIFRVFHDSYVFSLMRLFEKNNKSASLTKFLKNLKKECHDSERKNIVTKDLDQILHDDLRPVIENLKVIRNKKYAHSDFRTVIGEFVIPKDIIISTQELENLFNIMSNIVHQYSPWFGININLYITIPAEIDAIYSLISNHL